MDASNVLQLDEPISAGGIRSANFFNGRLLASGDLSREQDARREGDRRLGLALGEGVSHGLEVSFNATLSAPGLPVARVTEGLAVNRLGQTIRLTADVDIALARQFDATTAAGSFAACAPAIGGTYVAGAGVYVLTAAPAAATEGRAATNGLDPLNVRCNTDANVEAVLFRLLLVKPALYADLPLGTPGFRNALAYRCFGSGVLPGWLAPLFNETSRNQGLLDQMRPDMLTDTEAPIALLFFTGAADLQFIDAWSVRRPLAPAPAAFPPGTLADRGRHALGMAMFLQFQAQIAELTPVSGGLAVTARADFGHLPPLGIIPVAEETDATDLRATAFFTGMTYRSPVFIDAAALEPLLRDSLLYPPIDTRAGEMIWLYRVRENRIAVDRAGNGGPPRSYLVFATGHIPWRGDAQADLASFNYANYARMG
jgi:hypothetical protein